MNEAEALKSLIPPSQTRPGKVRGGVLQIHITRACDLGCFGCTQGSNLRGKTSFISPDNFEIIVKSLKDYFGVIGVFGGNPALSPQFPELCEILRQYIPKDRCGLWCNHPRGYGAEMRKTFNPAVSNLNVHLVKDAYDEFKRDWPESAPFGLIDDSRHSPPYVAMQDVVHDEAECWNLIANCDINKNWSAMACEIKGEPYGYFCEIAAAQAILHQNDDSWPITGIPIKQDANWWKHDMTAFASQVKQHCFACGVPLRGYGALAQGVNGKEQVSATHADVYQPKKLGRLVELVEDINQIDSRNLKFTEYMQGAKK